MGGRGCGRSRGAGPPYNESEKRRAAGGLMMVLLAGCWPGWPSARAFAGGRTRMATTQARSTRRASLGTEPTTPTMHQGWGSLTAPPVWGATCLGPSATTTPSRCLLPSASPRHGAPYTTPCRHTARQQVCRQWSCCTAWLRHESRYLFSRGPLYDDGWLTATLHDAPFIGTPPPQTTTTSGRGRGEPIAKA